MKPGKSRQIARLSRARASAAAAVSSAGGSGVESGEHERGVVRRLAIVLAADLARLAGSRYVLPAGPIGPISAARPLPERRRQLDFGCLAFVIDLDQFGPGVWFAVEEDSHFQFSIRRPGTISIFKSLLAADLVVPAARHLA